MHLRRLYYLGSIKEAEQAMREGTKFCGSGLEKGQRDEEHLPLTKRFQAGLLFYARDGMHIEPSVYPKQLVTGHVGGGGAAYSQ